MVFPSWILPVAHINEVKHTECDEYSFVRTFAPNLINHSNIVPSSSPQKNLSSSASCLRWSKVVSREPSQEVEWIDIFFPCKILFSSGVFQLCRPYIYLCWLFLFIIIFLYVWMSIKYYVCQEKIIMVQSKDIAGNFEM